MMKRRPTVTRHPERLTYSEAVLDHGPDDRQWLMMRDWMARMELRFDEFATRMDERFARMDERFIRVEERLGRVEAQCARVEERFSRVEERLTRVEERLMGAERQIMDVMAIVKELAATAGGLERRLSVVEPRIEDLVAWKHRLWGIVVAMSMLSGIVTFGASLLARHIVG